MQALPRVAQKSWHMLQELTSSSHSISSFFTATDWEYHQSATRYFRNLLNIRESTVYKRILAPCLTVTAFSALVALYNSTHTLPSKAPCSPCFTSTIRQGASCMPSLRPASPGGPALVALYNSTRTLPSESQRPCLTCHSRPQPGCCMSRLMETLMARDFLWQLSPYSRPSAEGTCQTSQGHSHLHGVCTCSVHNCHNTAHLAGLSAEPAAGVSDQCQLRPACGRTQGTHILHPSRHTFLLSTLTQWLQKGNDAARMGLHAQTWGCLKRLLIDHGCAGADVAEPLQPGACVQRTCLGVCSRC